MRRPLSLVLLLLVLLAGCVVKVRKVRVDAHAPPHEPVVLTTPVKAHLADGSTIVYARGVIVTATALEGEGERFDLNLRSVGPAKPVGLDSVVAFESFRTGTDAVPSVVLSVLGTALGGLATAALAVAVFGSCPTIYVDSAGTELLQGEAFSYSIAPLFEMRDVDRIHGRTDEQGIVWIEVRNEALETHYLNFMELLQVPHGPADRLLPDEQGRPVLTRTLMAARTARDVAGRDVSATLADADSSWFGSAPELTERPQAYGYLDRIDLTFDLPEARDSVALVLRLRNSLLNTVLFYDVMLGAAGARSVDWLGGTLDDIGRATEVGRWYRNVSGIRVYVERDGDYRQVARVADAGPIADKELALVLPTGREKELRVRLEFLADSWRIDQVGVSPYVVRPADRVIPVSVVTTTTGVHDTAAVSRMLSPDERYLTTTPGTALRVGFDASVGDADASVADTDARVGADTKFSYLLAAQGYYTEWIRGDWIRDATTTQTFVPGDAALDAAYERWREVRTDFERQFFERRVPVRQP
jgi:hypothetical protein